MTRLPTDVVWPYNTLSIFHSDNRACDDVGGSTPLHKFTIVVAKDKAIPLQAWRGPEGSRRLTLPDFKTIGT